jgi:uncharacterized protein
MIDRRSFVRGGLVALAVPMSLPAFAQAPALRMSTGAAGGTFFEYGAGMARLIKSKAQIDVEALPSGGTIENLRRIESGAAELALAAMGPAYEAWNASAAPWLGQPPLKRARALVPMYETPFHLATIQSSNLRIVKDLDGKKVGVGPKGGSNEQIFQKMADGVAIKPVLVFGDPGELAGKVISGEIDALFFGAGAPIPAYAKIAAEAAISFIPLDGAAAQSLRAAFPYMTVNAIPAGTYKGQTDPVATVALWNFIVARDDLSVPAAYAITKAILANSADARAVHPAAMASVIANINANTFMPFHPGAVQYLVEAGIPATALAR